MKKLVMIVALVGVLTSCGIIRERAEKARAVKEEAARVEAYHRDAVAKMDADQKKYDELNNRPRLSGTI